MQIGFGLPVSGSWATPDHQVEVARRAEELGYSSLWTFQRTLYPDAQEGQRLAPPYRSVHDVIVPAAFVAGVTTRIRLGLAIVNMPYYSPLVLAKMLTSLDIVSGGRLDVGLGLGWSPEEFEAAGVDMARRGARGEDFIGCLRAIWSQDPVEYSGPFYRVPRGHVDPKPVQSPHPPLILGGGAEPALRRAGRIADGWVSASRVDPAALPGMVATIRAAATDAGRDPSDVRIIVRGVLRIRSSVPAERPLLMGSYDEVRRDLDRVAEAGVDEVFVDLNFDEEIGSPDADPAVSMTRAHEVLDAFAPR